MNNDNSEEPKNLKIKSKKTNENKTHKTDNPDKQSKKVEECVELKNLEYKNMLLNHSSNKKKSKSTNIDIGEFLKNEKQLDMKQSWNKLEKSTKLSLLMIYSNTWVDNYISSIENDDAQSVTKNRASMIASLKKYLQISLNRKKLLKTKEVEYDKIKCTITNIPGLYYNVKRKKFLIKSTDKKNSTLKNMTPVNKKVTNGLKKDNIQNKDRVRKNDKNKTMKKR